MSKGTPVVDGEIGGDIYGYATTFRGARRVANSTFADEIDYVYLQTKPFVLRDGTLCALAWVAVTKQ